MGPEEKNVEQISKNTADNDKNNNADVNETERLMGNSFLAFMDLQDPKTISLLNRNDCVLRH